jgi:hypothetical protein
VKSEGGRLESLSEISNPLQKIDKTISRISFFFKVEVQFTSIKTVEDYVISSVIIIITIVRHLVFCLNESRVFELLVLPHR